MGVIGVLLAAILYVGGMSLFVKHFISSPIPELQYIEGTPRLILKPNARRLRIASLVKFFVSLNPKNYFSLKLSVGTPNAVEKSEVVEPELRPLLHDSEVPREAYRRAILMVTDGRVEQLRWIFPTSLFFFPIFGLAYFLGFSWLNRRNEKTEFVRGADLMQFDEMKSALRQAVDEEANGYGAFVPLCLGEAALPDSVSRRHILVLGTSGTGKSVCLNHYLSTLKARRAAAAEVNKCVIYDVKGEFCGKHLEKDDLIFYPFDTRSVPWSFFNEVLDYPDLDVLCTSLYEPPKDSKDAYWYNAARDVFRTGLLYLLR
ncbi:MAG: type IV secretion system DNA-binding domain-containing protein [Acidobacteriota bacterium]|nr:type IV secretion system DNA-binding domain-containing protein [Acidobacteriota bacterium]